MDQVCDACVIKGSEWSTVNKQTKIDTLLQCPQCGNHPLALGSAGAACTICHTDFPQSEGTYRLLRSDSPVLDWYGSNDDSVSDIPSPIRMVGKRILHLLRPAERVWTKESQNVITDMLIDQNPDHDDKRVVLIGAGFEPVFRRATRRYKQLIRLGLATYGQVDLAADITVLPIKSNSLDLIFSSSVLEHVHDPEKAVSEMARVVKPGGYVYAEIPFMRAYHMMPVDYQRYTITGIEMLFQRHGFETIQKGVCSGPFTASILFFLDFWRGALAFNKYLMMGFDLVFSLLLHPFKYLDRLVEGRKWAAVNACNVYFFGRIPE